MLSHDEGNVLFCISLDDRPADKNAVSQRSLSKYKGSRLFDWFVVSVGED